MIPDEPTYQIWCPSHVYLTKIMNNSDGANSAHWNKKFNFYVMDFGAKISSSTMNLYLKIYLRAIFCLYER